jgi:exodeoxyribonuclease VII small subunit
MSKKKEGTVESGTDAAAIDSSIAELSCELSYEDAMKELETLVEHIERGDVGLEASLASYRRGEQLLRHLKGLLDRAETTVRTMSLAEAERGG